MQETFSRPNILGFFNRFFLNLCYWKFIEKQVSLENLHLRTSTLIFWPRRLRIYWSLFCLMEFLIFDFKGHCLIIINLINLKLTSKIFSSSTVKKLTLLIESSSSSTVSTEKVKLSFLVAQFLQSPRFVEFCNPDSLTSISPIEM